jgi:hypothetical protein
MFDCDKHTKETKIRDLELVGEQDLITPTDCSK